MLNPVVLVGVFLVGGIASLGSFIAMKVVTENPGIKVADLLPPEPGKGPPLPRVLLKEK